MDPYQWKEINRLLDEAFELEPDKRNAFLEEACAGDVALKQEVERLLYSDERARSFIEIPAVQTVAESLLKDKLSSGQSLGPYKIVSEIGAGGMGEVYRAQDPRLDRIVALKILPAHLANDQERMRRFQQEAIAASKLSHPNVAHIYELSSSGNIRFIAMEYVEGRTLDARINEGSLEVTEMIEIGMQVADALDEAHQKGITHRDIKPANIMIKEKGHVKVLDFGLAKIFRPAKDAPSTRLSTIAKTEAGLVFGTVPYMSPEQALGREVDQRSDIFSLGSVLYQMATGKLPFTGIGTAEVLDSIVHSDPDPISSFKHNSPPELERIIRKCLEKDRERRYQSCRELYVDLKNFTRNSEAAPVAKQVTYPAGSVRRFRMHAMIVLLFLTAIAGIALLSRMQNRQTIHSIAVLPFLNSGGNQEIEYLSDGITESTINSLSLLPEMKVMAPGTVFTYKGKTVDPRKVGRDLKVDAVLSGRVRQIGDSLIIEASLADVSDGSQLWGGQFRRPLSGMADLASEISRELSGKLQLKLTGQAEKLANKQYTNDGEAYGLYLKGRYFFNKRGLKEFTKAIEFFQQAIEKDPNYALAYAGLAEVYAHLDLSKSKAAANKALELDDNLAEAHVSMAAIKSLEWDWAGEEKEYKKAIQLNPNLANAHMQYGDLFAILGDLDQAIQKTKLAQKLDPLSVHIATALSYKLSMARRDNEALAEIHKAIEIDPNFPMAHRILARIYLGKGMYQESIQEDARAMTLRGREAEITAQYVQSLQDGVRENGSRGYWEKKLELAKIGIVEFDRPVDPTEMALVYTQLGQKDQAFRWLEKAYQDRSYNLVYIKCEPLWDPIRTDPRYAELLKKCRLL